MIRIFCGIFFSIEKLNDLPSPLKDVKMIEEPKLPSDFCASKSHSIGRKNESLFQFIK